MTLHKKIEARRAPERTSWGATFLAAFLLGSLVGCLVALRAGDRGAR